MQKENRKQNQSNILSERQNFRLQLRKVRVQTSVKTLLSCRNGVEHALCHLTIRPKLFKFIHQQIKEIDTSLPLAFYEDYISKMESCFGASSENTLESPGELIEWIMYGLHLLRVYSDQQAADISLIIRKYSNIVPFLVKNLSIEPPESMNVDSNHYAIKNETLLFLENMLQDPILKAYLIKLPNFDLAVSWSITTKNDLIVNMGVRVLIQLTAPSLVVDQSLTELISRKEIQAIFSNYLLKLNGLSEISENVSFLLHNLVIIAPSLEGLDAIFEMIYLFFNFEDFETKIQSEDLFLNLLLSLKRFLDIEKFIVYDFAQPINNILSFIIKYELNDKNAVIDAVIDTLWKMPISSLRCSILLKEIKNLLWMRDKRSNLYELDAEEEDDFDELIIHSILYPANNTVISTNNSMNPKLIEMEVDEALAFKTCSSQYYASFIPTEFFQFLFTCFHSTSVIFRIKLIDSMSANMTAEDISIMESHGLIKFIISTLKECDYNVTLKMLDILETLAAKVLDAGQFEPFYKIFVFYGGIDILQSMQLHSKEEVYRKSSSVLAKYFNDYKIYC